METPRINYLAIDRDPASRLQLKKAISDLKKLDEQAARLEKTLITFLNTHSYTIFSDSMYTPIKQLRYLISCYTKDYQQVLTEQK